RSLPTIVCRIPGLVIARRFRTSAGGERRAGWPQRTGRAGHIWPVRLLPRPRLVVLLSRWRVNGVMQPAMPRRRHAWGFRIAVGNHPAPFETECRVNLAAAAPVITVAEFVLADRLTIHPGPELGPEGLRIPPGEQLDQETFHACQHCKKFNAERLAILVRPSPAREP